MDVVRVNKSGVKTINHVIICHCQYFQPLGVLYFCSCIYFASLKILFKQLAEKKKNVNT